MTPPDAHDDRELQFHLEMLTRRYIEEGFDPVAARKRAQERMGDLRTVVAERRAIEQQGAGRRRTGWWLGWGQDLRHAWRVLKRSPAFVGIAVLMLGLGTGASTAVFSVVDAVLVRSAFGDAESIALVYVRRPDGQVSAGVPRDVYERIADSLPSPLAAVGLHTIASPVVTRVETPRRTQTECLSPSMAGILGTRPMLGRWFGDDDARPGAPLVAVVSWKFWRGTLGGDPSVLGRVIVLDNEPVTILGVMPPGFDGPLSRVNRDIWVPYGPSVPAALRVGCRSLDESVNAVARLRPGVSMETGSAALSAAAGAVPIVLYSIRDVTVGDLEPLLNALAGAVVAVLLIAFANVTNLGLERLAGRRHEVSLRLALGATRGRIIRETVAEHVVIATTGAMVGVAVAILSFDVMVALLPASLPNLDAVTLNARVLAMSIGLALAGGVAAGVLSAWRAAASRPGSSLMAGNRGHTGRHTLLRRVLVTGELALGVLLLVAALLMIRTFLTLRPSAPGFNPDGKHIALVRLADGTPHAERLSFVDDVARRLTSEHGIAAVAATTSVPMRRSVAVREVSLGAETANAYTGAVTPNYFDLMDIPLRKGRGLLASDVAGAPQVAVVNETFVQRWFPDSEPVGQTFTLGGRDEVVLRIVGVIADTRSFGGDTRIRPFVYRPLAQAEAGNAFFVIDANGRAASDLPATVRKAVAAVRPGALVDEVERLVDEMNAEVAQPRLGAWLFGAFAGLAVLLAAVGLAATLTWSVTARRREIGIRVALGATRADVRRLVVGQTLAVSATGIALGLIGAAGATRLLAGWLYGISPLDPSTFAACGACMLGVALVAAWLPMRRASGVDPVVALRADG